MDETQIKSARGRTKAALTRLENNANDINSKNEILIRLERLDKLFSEFENFDASLKEGDSEIIEFEDRYFSLKAKFQDKLDVLNSSALTGIQNSTQSSQNVDQNSIVNNICNFRLPKLNIPQFSGNFNDWINFKDLFVSTVHSQSSLSNIQKFQYLKGVLADEPASLIKHMPLSNDSYIEAWEKLLERYDNKKQIVQSLIKTFLDQKSIQQVNNSNLRALVNTSDEVVRGLKALGEQASSRDPWLIYLLLQKLDAESRRLWSIKTAEIEFPKLKDFFEFLNIRCSSIELSVSSDLEGKPRLRGTDYVANKNTQSSKPSKKCIKCNGNHGLYNCVKFKMLNVESRKNFIRKNGLCFICFNAHQAKNCSSNYWCRICKQKHNTLLHDDALNTSLHVSSNPEIMQNEKQSEALSDANLSLNSVKTASNCILPTAVVEIFDSSGQGYNCRILLDSGSMASFISEGCVNKLGLKRKNARFTVSGIGGSNSATTKGLVNITVKSKNNEGHKINLEAYILDKLTALLPPANIDTSNLSYLDSVQLADPEFSKSGHIDVIIGAQHFFQILRTGQIIGPEDQAIAQNTIFGWVISGKTKTKGKDLCGLKIISVHSEFNIDDTLKQFWKTEELLPKKEMLLTDEEQFCEDHFKANYKILSDGKFEVMLPFYKSKDQLGDSKSAAVSRLFAMERKFKMNGDLHNNYKEFMREYEQMGHMILINSKCEKNNFLPHHAVVRPSSTTTQLRVVFDGSCKTSSSLSLNSVLGVGPVVQRDLFSILLNFRLHEYAVTADIVKMYRQVWVNEDDQNYQCIVWRNDSESEIQEYKLKTVTYGTASAPFLATRVLKQIGLDCQQENPELSKTIIEEFYMDDLLSGEKNSKDCINKCLDLSKLLASHGFILRKWRSNSSEVLKQLAQESKGDSLVEFLPNKDSKVLGLYWDSKADCFTFNMDIKIDTDITKRNILSKTAKIFDPLGFLSPCTVVIKMFYQKLWLYNLDWDTPVPEVLKNEWKKYQDGFEFSNSIKIPRWLKVRDKIQIHGFCDASELAYAAVLYAVQVMKDGSRSSTIVVAKTKLAPIKQISIPRLELNAALLLARLLQSVWNAYKDYDIEFYAWTDAKVVLSWLSEHPRKWKPFVANRTSEILEVIPRERWRHVPSKENPADIASRGLNPEELSDCSLWWSGPSWLVKKNSDWPKDITFPAESDSTVLREQKSKSIFSFTMAVVNDTLENLFEKFSSFSKIVNITSYCLRFISKCKKAVKSNDSDVLISSNSMPLSTHERQYAQNLLVRWVQTLYFKDELKCLKTNVPLSSKSAICSLHPFIDKDGVLRVGGRLQNSLLAYNAKHPIILPKQHKIAMLLIKQFHITYLHAGPTLLVNILRQSFWILKCKKLVQYFVSKCIVCLRHKSTVTNQLMGNLPKPRVIPQRPFANTGIDYAGPLTIKLSKGRGAKVTKGYVAVFVCLTTKAVHLEAVSELTAEAFIAALRRFSSRRGTPRHIYCDNATNFVGAKRKLDDFQRFLLSVNENEIIAHYLSQSSIEFHFIPPASPHFGGLWEAAVKAMKFHLKRVIKNTLLTFEELGTLLTQVEACLNSRPLSSLSDGDDGIQALTPAHFLIGDTLFSPLDDLYSNDNISLSSRWNLVQNMRQGFWKAWNRDYLNSLQPRVKWKKEVTNFQINDLVLLRDERLPPSVWPLGRVTNVFPGQDGIVRVLQIKTVSGTVNRPITKAIRIPSVCQE